MNFEGWLAKLLGQSVSDVHLLLQEKAALHFLIAWSLFESKCFNGFVKEKHLEAFSRRIVAKESFNTASISAAAAHFHARYRDKGRYKNLVHENSSPKMTSLLQQPLHSLQPQDAVFLVAFTVYRFRNNIFHGNKKVEAWLRFKEQIEHCIDGMKAFISHAESLAPSLRLPHAA